jgi:4-amino-4-deoxy-L-arabinose transferase-like glycosyltransferase
VIDERDARPAWYGNALIAVAVVGVALRVWLVAAGRGTARFLEPDSRGYRALANHLPGDLWSPSRSLLRLSVDRGPGYPLFLRLVSPVGSHVNLAAIVLAQCIVGGALTVYLVAELGRRLFAPFVGISAAALLATDPLSIGHGALVLTETLYAALLVGTLFAFERTVRTQSMRWAAGTGGLFAASLFVRPTLVYFTPFLAVGFALVLRNRRAWLLGLLAFMVAAVPVGSWYVRNDSVGGGFTFSTIEAFNLFEFRAAGAVAAEQHIAIQVARAQLQAKYAKQLATTNLATLDAVRRRAGIHEIVTHPRGYVSTAGHALGRAITGAGYPYVERQLPPTIGHSTRNAVTELSVWNMELMYALAIGGIVTALWRRKWFALALLGLPTVAYLVLSAGPETYSRFRVPVQPMICVLAGVGAVALVDASSAVLARIAAWRAARAPVTV